MRNILNTLSGVFAYVFEADRLSPVLVAVKRDEAGALVAWVADLANNRKGSTTPGAAWESIDLDASIFYTFGSVARAARKATTPVVMGRSVEVNPRSRFGIEIGRLTAHPMANLVTADWREQQHDAEKVGYTLDELLTALRECYTQ